jgi:hypothetical protein
MSGEWPPDWEDPDEVFPDQADQLDEEASARLSAVSAYLASAPAPGMPDSVRARISAAIAAEAAARSQGPALPVDNTQPVDNQPSAGYSPPPVDSRSPGDNPQPVDNRPAEDTFPPGAAVPARTLGPAPARARVRRRLSARTFLVAGPVLFVCLFFAGIGFLLSRSSLASSSSSSASSIAGAASEAGPNSPSSPAAGPAAGSAESPFTLTASGVNYRPATLAGQVRAVLAGPRSAGATAPTGSSSSAARSSATTGPPVTPQLRGCVLHFTNGAAPKLVDQATYNQGTPVYVIASATRVWVVGLDCTATDPELIASVPLAG